MDRGPVGIVVERTPLVHWYMLVILDVGHQFGSLGGHYGAQLGGEHRRRRLQLFEPREETPRVKLSLRELGIMIVGGATVIGPGAPHAVAAEAVHALFLLSVGSCFGRGHARLQP